jgi:hypothetical protein
MNIIFTTNTKEFSPISSGDSYLYEKYNLLSSFLKAKLSASEVNRFSKPVINGTFVDWYGNNSEKMTRLTDFPSEWQEQVERLYLIWYKKIQTFANELNNSGDADKSKWGNLLNAAFNIENNILISDGKEWAIIWGWEFRNKLSFVNPNFISDVKNQNDITEEQIPPPPEQPPRTPVEPFSDKTNDYNPKVKQAEKEPDVKPMPPIPKNIHRNSLGFWELIKRFFRWIAYKFWGLMMLFIYTLLIIFLWEKCNNKKPNCEPNNQIQEKLKYIEGRAKEKCIQINQRP